ncbi:MAG TPA: nucleotidyl transferase AbiEii/AbiGii toxin family protein [Longimicrobiaceae bacterium]
MLNPDYRDILSELSGAGAEFLVVGAFAMAAHSMPRATGDLDLWIRPDAENARRVWTALARFGAPVGEITYEELTEPGLFLQIGVAPVRIDLLTEIDGVSFGDAWEDRTERDLEGVRVPVISRRHLLINKKATGRPKDLADVAWIEEQGID